MFTKLKNLMDGFMEMGVPGYDCIVYHKGECVYREMNGYTDLEKKIPVKGDERYNIYSCSKPITCTAALQLYEHGKFKLDDKLSKYLPEFDTMYVNTENGIKKAENSITIKDLFCMTAGFSYDLNSQELIKLKKDTNGKCPTREAMRYLAKEPLLFEPGTQWHYSLCHDILAAVVEVISDMKFEEYVKKNIFDILGMDNSTFLLPFDEFDTVAAHYVFDNETKKVKLRSKIPAYRFGSEYASGGAGCVSTVDDYIKFLEAMRMGDIILKNETIHLMSTNCLSSKQLETYINNRYGYGLGVRCPIDGKPYPDFGWGGAAGSYLSIDKVNDITLFYVQHLMKSPNQSIRYKVYDVANEIIVQKKI